MIVRMGYCAGEAGHDLSGEEGLEASLPMRSQYGVLSHKAVHQEQDADKTTEQEMREGRLRLSLHLLTASERLWLTELL